MTVDRNVMGIGRLGTVLSSVVKRVRALGLSMPFLTSLRFLDQVACTLDLKIEPSLSTKNWLQMSPKRMSLDPVPRPNGRVGLLHIAVLQHGPR